jgi:hypothetical protein
MTKPPANVLELHWKSAPKWHLAAIERVIVEHARKGLPIYIWRDGSIVELSGEPLRAEAERLQAEIEARSSVRARTPSLLVFKQAVSVGVGNRAFEHT